MKRLILALTAGVFALNGFAQTHADLSMNLKTGSGQGFTFEFDGNDGNNCLGQHVAAFGTITTQTWTIDQATDELNVVTTGSQGTTETQIMQFYNGDCNGTTINLSNTADQKLRLVVNASVAVPELLVVIYGAGNTTSNLSNTPNLIALAAGDNDITVNLDLTGITSASSIQSIGLVPRNAWDDANLAVTLKFDLIQIGDAIVVSGTNNAIVDNTLINVFPNPAKDEVNVDLARLNGQSANVKVINMYGEVVKEEVATSSSHKVSVADLEKGMYMIQVSADNKVSNKKVVVE